MSPMNDQTSSNGIYYVIPLVSGGTVQTCLYIQPVDPTDPEGDWQDPILARNLQTSEGGNVKLVQIDPTFASDRLKAKYPLKDYVVDPSVAFHSAVSRTLAQAANDAHMLHLAALPDETYGNLLLLAVDFSVTANMTCGAILVFAVVNANRLPVGLRATADPEISNSTNGSD